jgi:hypothetical protein
MLIGDLLVNPVRPDDLDAQVLALTGCSVEEVKGKLHAANAGLLARALHPFVPQVHHNALATAIAAAGVQDLRPQIAALYEGQEDVRPSRAGKRNRRRK